MASSTRGKAEMKGYFKEKKKTVGGGGIGKRKAPAATAKSKAKKQSPVDLNDDCDEKEHILMQFDMNMVYGPCVGISRMDRWDRANRQCLNPPKEIESILKEAKFSPACLWDGRL